MSEGIFLSVGSNLGDRKRNLEEAQRLLGLRVVRQSAIYETEPVGFLEQPWFLNAAWQVETNSGSRDLLRRCQEVENIMRRKREIAKGPRIIDLDILFYDNLIFSDPDLVIPHPALAERRFVLLPLNDVAPYFVHPTLLKTVSELLVACRDRSTVRLLPGSG